MNCSEARSLFSARVDFELTGSESLEHDRHLSNCPQCDHEWRSFQLTVRMVRTLPAEMASPSFVGQVLDKVRAYEAQPVPSYLDPADRPSERVLSPALASKQWKERLRGILAPFKSPVPAFAAASLVLGIVVGVVAMDGRSQSAHETRTAQIERIDPVPDLSRRGVDGDHSVNPFSDLADEIGRLPNVERRVMDSYEMLPPAQIWPVEPGLQQQVRAGDVRPRITF